MKWNFSIHAFQFDQIVGKLQKWKCIYLSTTPLRGKYVNLPFKNLKHHFLCLGPRGSCLQNWKLIMKLWAIRNHEHVLEKRILLKNQWCILPNYSILKQILWLGMQRNSYHLFLILPFVRCSVNAFYLITFFKEVSCFCLF